MLSKSVRVRLNLQLAWVLGCGLVLASSHHAVGQTPIHEYGFDRNGDDAVGSADGVVGLEIGFTSSGVPAGLGQAATFGTSGPFNDNDVIEVDNALFTGFGTGDFSIAVWVRRLNTSARGDIIDANGNANDVSEGDGPGFQLQVTTNDFIRLRIDDANDNVKPDSTGKIVDSLWHHVVITMDRDDANGFKYYIDGNFDSQHDPTSIPGNIDPHQDLRFGSINFAGSFEGEIALFQAFDVALTEDQVARLFCAAGNDCDNDGTPDACELGEVVINFDTQAVGPLARFSKFNYGIEQIGIVDPDIINVGVPAPSLGNAERGSTSETRIVSFDDELFEFVRADYRLTDNAIRFEGFRNGERKEVQDAPRGTGRLNSTFTGTIDELRIQIASEREVDAWVDNIVLQRVDDCDSNGVPDACDSDCDNNGVADGCDPDLDNDSFPDVCDPCAAGRGSADTEADYDSDLTDFAELVSCLEGINAGASSGCECFHLDGDTDVDLADVAKFATRLQLDPGCIINGVFYAAGETDAPDNTCLSCQPMISRTQWTLRSAGDVCRAGSGDLCDPDELCDGSSTTCPGDVVAQNGVLCRTTVNQTCDVWEVCTGVPGQACPPDQFIRGGSVCRSKNGPCDVAEVCSGSSPNCPADAVESSGTACRTKAGDCDIEEVCDGSAKSCPTDTFVAQGEICRSQVAGGCDLEETCTGTGPDCPPDAFRSAGTVCRPIAGVCDTDAEECNGFSAACPLDVQNYPVGGLECRPAIPPLDLNPLTQSCDIAESCNPNGPAFPNCPGDQWKLPGTVCREKGPTTDPGYAACDAVEKCSGVSPVCPGDARLDIGEVCDFDDGRTGECKVNVNRIRVECRPFGGGNIGDRCQIDSHCLSDNCIELGDRKFVCAETGDKGFGETCDGDDFFIIGDPNGRQCSNEGTSLVCCTGGDNGTQAGDGEVGTCQNCCRTNDVTGGTGENLVGCEVDLGETCCDGRCSKFDTDPFNCGSCGNNCYDKVTGVCKTEVLSCGRINDGIFSPGICYLKSACDSPGDFCYNDCAACEVAGIDCTGCTPGASCNAYGNLIVGVASCDACTSDDDCTESGETCWDGCGGGAEVSVLYCTNDGYCAPSAVDCGG